MNLAMLWPTVKAFGALIRGAITPPLQFVVGSLFLPVVLPAVLFYGYLERRSRKGLSTCDPDTMSGTVFMIQTRIFERMKKGDVTLANAVARLARIESYARKRLTDYSHADAGIWVTFEVNINVEHDKQGIPRPNWKRLLPPNPVRNRRQAKTA